MHVTVNQGEKEKERGAKTPILVQYVGLLSPILYHKKPSREPLTLPLASLIHALTCRLMPMPQPARASDIAVGLRFHAQQLVFFTTVELGLHDSKGK